VGKPEGKNHLEGPGVDGRIILKWICKKDEQDAHFRRRKNQRMTQVKMFIHF